MSISKGQLERLKNRIQLLNWLPKHSIVAEIGVFNGDYANRILDISRPSKLHLIDHWPYWQKWAGKVVGRGEVQYKGVLHRFRDHIELGIVQVHRVESTKASELFPDRYFDWIYIDANHSFEAVIADLSAWHRKTKTGGLIAGHDYINISGFGIIEAVDRFVCGGQLRLVALTVENRSSPSFVTEVLRQ